MRSLLPASGFAVLGRGGGEKNSPGSPCLPTYLAAVGSVKNSGVPLANVAMNRRCYCIMHLKCVFSSKNPMRYLFGEQFIVFALARLQQRAFSAADTCTSTRRVSGAICRAATGTRTPPADGAGRSPRPPRRALKQTARCESAMPYQASRKEPRY